MKLKEKYFILIIRRHAGEIDWILPLIYRLTKDIELITEQACKQLLANPNTETYKFEIIK